MKKKLKGVLGIGLTLVLLASLTVGLAAPAAADPATLKFSTLSLPKVDEAGDYWTYPGSDVGAIDICADGETLFAAATGFVPEFQVGPTWGVAEWSTTKAYRGRDSVYLSDDGVGYTNSTDYGAGRVVIPVDIDLADITSLSYWFNYDDPVTAYPYAFPYMILEIDSDPTGVPAADGWIVLFTSEPGYWSPTENTWVQWDLSTSATDHWIGFESADCGVAEDSPLADFQADADLDDAVVLAVKVAVGEWHTGSYTAITAYVDDITINGITYGLERSELMKSTDGGYAWKVLEGFRDEAGADTTAIVDVVVSPDYEDDLTVFVATEDFLYQSVDGGKRFVQMTTVWADTETITDLDIALDERGRLAIMVGTSSVIDVELGTSGGASTATWSTTWKVSGNYSAKLYAEEVTTHPYVDLTPATGIMPADLVAAPGAFGFHYNTNGWAPFFELQFTSGTDLVDITFMLQGQGVEDSSWQEVDLGTTTFQQTSIYDWKVPEQHDFDFDLAAGLAYLASNFADYELTRVRVELYPCEVRTSYIDDVTINGVTYDLEPSGAYGLVGDVYVLSTATGMSWQAQGIGAYDVLAVGFSPFFADDEGISAVVTDSTSTAVRFSFAYVGADDPSLGWPADIGDAAVQDALGQDFPSSHARIDFPDDFDAFGVGNNFCWVGIYAGTTGDPDNELGDVYKIKLASPSSATDLDIRGVITTLLPTATNIVSIDVCGDAEEASILVGTDYCSLVPSEGYFLVYRSDDGGETWIPSTTKAPTGGTDGYAVFENPWVQVLMSPDFLTDEIAYAATTGPGTSAFSRSKDGAATWNQIGLIDYGDVGDGYVIKDLDAAGYNVDGTLHMTTQVGGTYGAVWNRTDGKNWERIWSYANPAVTDDISELIINGDETMFTVDYAAKTLKRSSDMGATWPKTITTKANLTEVCIVSPTTLYTGHEGGDLYWSTKSGTAWQKPDVNPMTSRVGYMKVKGDTVLIGNVGAVHISTDGGETIERVGSAGDAGMGLCLVGFDLGFAENNIIYSSDAFAPFALDATNRVYRTEVDLDDPSASEWVSIDDIQDIAPYNWTNVIGAGPPGPAPPSGIMYIVDTQPVVTGDVGGGLWRCTNPTSDVDSPVPPYFEIENKGLDTDDVIGGMDADVFPFTLFCAVSNKTTAVPYYQQIVMFTDTLDSGVSLADPGDGAAGVGLIPAGEVKASLNLVWKEMAGARSYQYQVAIDPDFMSVIGSDYTDSLLTPTLALSPNKTFYWRVRVADEDASDDLIGAPLISPWSETWSFKTAIGATMARPELEAPEAGASDVLLSPTFEWSGIAWAEKYEFELATGPGTTAGGYFTDVLVGLTGTNALVSTAWKCDIALDYEARYYWHVKAIGVDTETPWSDVGTFTTMGVAPAPPEPAPPMVIPPVEEITPVWLWVIIGIGAALMIAVIILIVTTRRVP